MTDLKPFFESIQRPAEGNSSGLWGSAIATFETDFPHWLAADLVIIGVPFAGENSLPGMSGAHEAIRSALYRLSSPDSKLKTADLGNLLLRVDESTEVADVLRFVLEVLHEAGKRVLILGGSQELTLAQIRALETSDATIEYVQIDNRLDIESSEFVLNETSYNHALLHETSAHRLAFTNLGFQQYLLTEQDHEFLASRAQVAVRYGNLNEKMDIAEAWLRTAHVVSFDLNAMRAAEAPGAGNATPGGFSSMEACKLARYAGRGYFLHSFGCYGYDPDRDTHGHSAQLIAMMAWYLAEGISQQHDDYPGADHKNLKAYAVHLNASIPSINFYKHVHTARWWMELVHPDDVGKPHGRSRLVPCSESDYETARQDEIPERWWQAYNRIW